MKPLTLLSTLAALALCLGLTPATVRAASSVPANPAGQRYLFIVDKSSDMERLQDATEATIFDLVGSGLHGHMRSGDTFGIWTFSKEVTAGKFPMQIWDARKARQQATMVAAFLSGVEYEGSSATKDLTEKVKAIVHAVSNVTVLVISDGDAAMKGTPFDKTINAEYKRQRKQRASAKRPFVTTLIARDGWIIDQSVTIAGTQIILPPRPAVLEEEPPALVKEATPAGSLVSSPIVQAPAPPAPKPAPKFTIITKGPPESTVPNSTRATASAPVVAESQSSAERSASPVREPATAPAAIPTAPAADPGRSFEIASQESILAAAGNPGSATAASKAVPQPASENAIATPAPAAAAPTKTTPTATPAAAAIPVSSSAIEAILSRVAPEPTVVAARETASKPAPAGVASGTLAVQGIATPAVSSGQPIMLFAFGALMLFAALGLGFMVVRQRRPAAGASLITQSMERR